MAQKLEPHAIHTTSPKHNGSLRTQVLGALLVLRNDTLRAGVLRRGNRRFLSKGHLVRDGSRALFPGVSLPRFSDLVYISRDFFFRKRGALLIRTPRPVSLKLHPWLEESGTRV